MCNMKRMVPLNFLYSLNCCRVIIFFMLQYQIKPAPYPSISLKILDFRKQKLQFRPSFEEVRAKYYREMKKFISIPLHFRGVGDDTSIYPPLIERHASAFSTVFAKAEELFRRLASILDDFQDWIVLGVVDIDSMIEEHLVKTSDWEKNFKALKAKGKEAEKIPG